MLNCVCMTRVLNHFFGMSPLLQFAKRDLLLDVGTICYFHFCVIIVVL